MLFSIGSQREDIMQRKVILLIICALLLNLAGCARGQETGVDASPAPEEAVPTAPAGDYTYAEAYMQYLSVYSALRDTVDSRVETHNAILKSQYPDSYYMNSDYLMLVYAPFSTVYPGLGSALGRDNTEAAQTALRVTFSDAVLTSPAENCWEAVYTYIDKTSGEEIPRMGRCVWECAWLDDELAEFTEFIPQGNDLYLLYTMTDKALVRFTAGEVPAFWHAHRISEPAMDAFPGDERPCSLEDRDFFPSESVSVSWITGDTDAQYVLTLENSVMTYTGKVAQDQLDRNGVRAGISWMEIDPITLLS